MTSVDRHPPLGAPAERARALLRLPAYRRFWQVQLAGGIADRLALLVLTVLTVDAVSAESAHDVLGGGYRALLFALAAAFGARLAAVLVFGVLALGPLAQALHRADRRWVLLGSAGLSAALVGVAPFWSVWTPADAWIWLLVSIFVLGAAERVLSVARESVAEQLLPSTTTPGVPGPDQRPVLRYVDRRTGYAAVPLAAALLVVLALVNDGLGHGIDWLTVHQVAVPALGAAALFALAAGLLLPQELPAAPEQVPAPHSPLEHLRAPADSAPRRDGKRGRTGSSVLFSFAATGAASVLAGAAAVAYPHAHDMGAGPVGYGLLVLALTAGLLLGLRLARPLLPGLTRRRLLPLALGTSGLALILGGLVRDYVLSLVLLTLAGVAGGVAFRTARVLLAQETEEARQPRVDEHLHAMVRFGVGLALVAAPLVGAAFGAEQFHGTTLSWDHSGAGLAVAVSGLLALVYAVVLYFRTDDRRGTAMLGKDVWDALRGGTAPAPHRAGTGYFIALEGGDGAGKSTQAAALAEWIRSKGHEVVVTREPGGSGIGQRLRAMLLDVANTGISHRAEALMYAADRAEHVDSVIRPALERGAVVITDRYMDSSIAYQGAGRDLSGTEIARLNTWATDGLVPDLTVVLDVSPETARERFTEALDRLESEPAEFHARVRAGFLALAGADPARYLVVDAGQAPGAVTQAVRHRLDRELPLSEQEKAALAEQARLAAEAEKRRLEEEARRKAEEERAERERQALLERLRLEEEEREKARKAEEEAARRAAEAEARRKAEQERLAAEAEARRAAEAERAEQRRLAEEAARAAALAETARLAELARSREEERKRTESALLRAERSRADAETTVLPQVPHADETAVLPVVTDAEPERGADATETTVLPVVQDPESPAADATSGEPAAGAPGGADSPGRTVSQGDAEAAGSADGAAAGGSAAPEAQGESPEAEGSDSGAADRKAAAGAPGGANSPRTVSQGDAEAAGSADGAAAGGSAAPEAQGESPEADGSDSGPADRKAAAGAPGGANSPRTVSQVDAEAAGSADGAAAGGGAQSRTSSEQEGGGPAPRTDAGGPAGASGGADAQGATAPEAPGRTSAADVPGGERPDGSAARTGRTGQADAASESGTAADTAADTASGAAPGAAPRVGGGDREATTVMPVVPPMPVRPPVVGKPTTASSAAADETTVLPAVQPDPPAAAPAPETGGLGGRLKRALRGRKADDQDQEAEETTQLPTVPGDSALPRAWREATPRSAESVQDNVPEWLFRPDAGNERTQELPTSRPQGPTAPASPTQSTSGGRYDWAEATPLDDPLSLTDELLGTRQEWAQWQAAAEQAETEADAAEAEAERRRRRDRGR